MKELSIEEKAKAYDFAVEEIGKLRDMLLKQGVISEYGIINSNFERIFPELKESENDRIRKALIRFHKSTIDVDGIKGDDIIAWLEKQGEQKPTDEEMKTILQTEYEKGRADVIAEMQKPVDKVEPKFHEGDWAVSDLDKMTRYISEVHNDKYNNYYVIKGDVEMEYDINEYDRLHHLWTIQDAKDGDVLATEDSVFIFKYTHYEVCKSYCEVIGNSKLGLGFEFSINGVYPATKEQRGLLFQKMREAGYEWDDEKKELRKIEQKLAYIDDEYLF